MKPIAIALLVLLILPPQYAQSPKGKPGTDLAAPQYFYYDLLNSFGGDTVITVVDLFVQVPFNRVQFIKENNTFHGEYSITVSIYDSAKAKLVHERTWTEKVRTTDFHETLSKNNFNISRKSFNLRPKTYAVKIIFEDKDSKKSYESESLFKVRAMAKPFTVSDVMIISSQPAGSTKVMPNISGVIQSKDSSFPVYFELYSDTSRTYFLTFSVINQAGEVLYAKQVSRSTEKGVSQMSYLYDSLQLASGEYRVSVTLLDSAKKVVEVAQKRVSVRLSGLPFIIRDLDKAIDQMVYFAPTTAIDSIKKVKNYDEKLRAFLDFWKRKDPNDATEENEIFNEYYRRVEFANRNYQTYAEGWRTDMGMVYIILGPPSNIERHPFEYDSKPYEVWEYYELNKRFIFIDSSGFGDYRLITPLYGDQNRMR